MKRELSPDALLNAWQSAYEQGRYVAADNRKYLESVLPKFLAVQDGLITNIQVKMLKPEIAKLARGQVGDSDSELMMCQFWEVAETPLDQLNRYYELTRGQQSICVWLSQLLDKVDENLRACGIDPDVVFGKRRVSGYFARVVMSQEEIGSLLPDPKPLMGGDWLSWWLSERQYINAIASLHYGVKHGQEPAAVLAGYCRASYEVIADKQLVDYAKGTTPHRKGWLSKVDTTTLSLELQSVIAKPSSLFIDSFAEKVKAVVEWPPAGSVRSSQRPVIPPLVEVPKRGRERALDDQEQLQINYELMSWARCLQDTVVSRGFATVACRVFASHALVRLADWRLRAGNLEDAASSCVKALSIYQPSPRGWLLLAEIHADYRDTARAVKLLGHVQQMLSQEMYREGTASLELLRQYLDSDIKRVLDVIKAKPAP